MAKKKYIDPTLFENKALKLPKKKLDEIANLCFDGYVRDRDSQSDWIDKMKRSSKLFFINRDGITINLEGGSNVGLPVLTTALIQYAARASDALLPSKDIMRVKELGSEKSDSDIAERVAKYMNFQIDNKIPRFRESFDISLMKKGLDGSVIRKTYYGMEKKTPISDWCRPTDFVINNDARSIEDSERYSYKLHLTVNEIKKKFRSGEYKKYDDMDEGNPNVEQDKVKDQARENEGKDESITPDETSTRLLIEQYVLLNLDDEKGIKEPYIVTFDYEHKNILSIIRNKHPYKDKPLSFFTKYDFIPNPDGFWGLGLGILLSDSNEAMNKILNDIIDAGMLQNTKFGFLLEGLGMKKGDLSFKMGEFKAIKLKTDDIRKAIQEFQFSGPSTVLFSVLELMQNYTNRLTSITETSVGEIPASGVTATAVARAAEEGVKFFNSIHKRDHRSFKEELLKIYELNSIYLNIDEYFAISANEDKILDMANEIYNQELQKYEKISAQSGAPIEQIIPPQFNVETILDELIANIKQEISSDFMHDLDVVPISDVNIISKQEKAAKAQLVYETAMTNPLTAQNPKSIYHATVNYLKSADVEEYIIDQIIEEPQPPPPPPDLPQEEENAMILRDEIPSVLPEQDHVAHELKMEEFSQSEFYALFSPQQKAVFEQHYRTHKSFEYLQGVQALNQVEEQIQNG